VQQLREQFGSARETVRLGFLTPFLDDIVAPAIRTLRERDGADVALFELSPRDQLDRLRAGELDAAVLGNFTPSDRDNFAVTTLMRARMAAVVPSGHPLSHRRRIDLRELSGDSFVSLSEIVFPGRRTFFRDICMRAGFEPEIVEECDSLSLLLAAVSSGSGAALLPLHSRKIPHAGCHFLPIRSPAAHAEVVTLTRREDRRRITGNLLGALADSASEIESS